MIKAKKSYLFASMKRYWQVNMGMIELIKDKHVKIILLYNEEEKQNRILPNIFYNPVITTQYKLFQREEIYRE